MTFDDNLNDHVLAAVANLRTHDVSQRHTDRLRRRCHVVLLAEPGRNLAVDRKHRAPVGRVIGQVLGGAWCLAYLVEIILRAAAAL